MNDYVAKITLDLNCQATPVVISAGQFDIGRKIQITLTADGEAYDATGATAVCKGKSGSNYFAVNATVEKDIVTVTTDKAMLSSAGRTVAKIVLTDGTRTYSTQPFVINTHSDYDGDITASDYYPELLDILSRVIALTESGAVLTDTALDAKSVNPVQNKVLTGIINNLVPNEEGFINTFNLADGAVTLDKLAADLAKIINNKVNKATTLNGYGITDAYTKATVKLLLAGKLDAMSFDNEPTLNSPCYLTSGTVYSALTKKFDNSNIETGKGNLAPAQAIYDGYEGSFNYEKIGKIVTVALNITTLIAGKNYVQFAGLPFTAKTASRLSSIVAYTTANKLVNLRLDGSWLYISSPDTTFADGEKINAIITYIIG